jgi:DNA-directed RNA polymerase subunit RPC12/RpoP
MHGDYLSSPVWNLTQRKVRLAADMTQIIRQEEIRELSVEEINRRIATAFQYDEYRYQVDTKQKITLKTRAEGLHRVLYHCPNCHTEHEMDSAGDKLFCTHCHKTWVMDEYGKLHAETGKTEFSHIPDWYEFERAQVRQSLLEGTYHFEDDVIVDALPNADGYVRLGEGHLVHDQNGFRLTGNFNKENFDLEIEPLSLYSLHIEYDYLGKGADCIDLSTLTDTFYIYPKTQKNVVTKLHFAVEELYKITKEKKRQESR